MLRCYLLELWIFVNFFPDKKWKLSGSRFKIRPFGPVLKGGLAEAPGFWRCRGWVWGGLVPAAACHFEAIKIQGADGSRLLQRHIFCRGLYGRMLPHSGEFRPISALRTSLRSVALRNAPAGAVRRATRRCPPWTRTGLVSGDRKANRCWALGFGHGAAPAGAPDSPVHQWPGNRFALCSFGLQAPTKKPAHR